MEGVKLDKIPKLKNPYLILAWPGMGEVASQAGRYLMEQLKAVEFASIPAEDFFYLTGSVVEKGLLSAPSLPQSKFYYWKNSYNKGGGRDLIIFLSSAQPDLANAQNYCERIIKVAQYFKVKTIIGFAAMPQPIDHTQEPHVWFAASHKELLDNLKKYNFNLLNEGQISGMNGLFLGLAKERGLAGFCLLGEIPLYTIQIKNPKASLAVLNALSKIIGIKIDFSKLTGQIQTMEDEINKFLDYLKIGSSTSGPIGEEDIEKMKKALAQLTKLPVSVKENVEKLFISAKKDISQAAELKKELDKWNVYKEYEDRFLDLFRKAEDKGAKGN